MTGLSDFEIVLTPLDEPALARLLAAAVDGAEPHEVMPPVDGPPGWTPGRRAAFLAFHRRRSLDPDTAIETTWLVEVDGRAAGAARLQPVLGGSAIEVEAGVWLGRWARGRGIGKRVAEVLLESARDGGATRFIASTTVDNTAARRLLRGTGAELDVHGAEVDARLEL
ncbi:GNAT family N-acetyltransferase [Amycolatopsis sp. PS_44_ISF1]|uniref:GNAT family N-acetyltransferase n=1 Tax=Amycolatopsis sp. PS_44_ISF1 TaxID=2974917 RepID=UPI0028DF1B89|nr:GNAT family N-acetyltransferase [Amycolatopsis sp. PS_44_ISF1]MDT8915531.1 GNAT family N-acetyltransferase [Amycolatopsis sp. PS_44_ISF1]